MRFFCGISEPAQARHLERCCISANRLRRRVSDFEAGEWMMDSGAFTEVTRFGRYRDPVDGYAALIDRWSSVGSMVVAVAQDYMCEPFVVRRTGLSVRAHQELTIERFVALQRLAAAPILPVLQGFQPWEYVAHLEMYGSLLTHGAWVGVGSVCKRNARPGAVLSVLEEIKAARPDLRLHGFGVKMAALQCAHTAALLWSADSMAWSFAARYEGRDHNHVREAVAYAERVRRSVGSVRGAQQLELIA